MPPSAHHKKKNCIVNPRRKKKKVSFIQDLTLLHILETSTNLATDPLGYFLEAELSKTENIFVALLWTWRYSMNSQFVKNKPSVTSFSFSCIFKDYFNIFIHYVVDKIMQSYWNCNQKLFGLLSLKFTFFFFFPSGL